MNKTNDDLQELKDLLAIIDLKTLDSNVIDLLNYVFTHLCILQDTIKGRDEEIAELKQKIRTMHKKHFEFTSRCCKNY